MPPFIPALGPRDCVASPFQNEDVFDEGTLFEGGVNDGFCGDGLSTTAALIAGDDDAAFTVLYAVTEGLCGESGEYDRVDCADTGAGEEGCDGVPGHGEVDGDGVTALDAIGFEDVGYTAYFVEEFGVGYYAAFAWFVCLVDDGGLGCK